MAIVLFDNLNFKSLYPLTQTRAIADLPLGIVTISQWWQLQTTQQVFIFSQDVFHERYEPLPLNQELLWIDAALIPDEALLAQIINLKNNEAIADDEGLVAMRSSIAYQPVYGFHAATGLQTLATNVTLVNNTRRLQYPHQIFLWANELMHRDFELLTKGRTSQPVSSTNNIISGNNIFIEEGAVVEFATINAGTGPVYIGKNCTIMEGSCIRGPFAMLDGSVVKMGATIYGATRLGKSCVAGGEIKNAVLLDYSNKAHHGYLGDSVIGSFCNLGAGTTNSNVKNTCGNVSLYNAATQTSINAGFKAGCIMGDYTTTAINTSINTGTVIGIACNIFGGGFTPKHINNFSWGLQGQQVNIGKALVNIERWKKLKGESLTEAEKTILQLIFDQS